MATRIESGGDLVDAAIMACDSPIERILLGHLMQIAAAANSRIHLHIAGEVHSLGTITHTSELHIHPQWRHREYRADFKLEAEYDGRSRTLVVECDGHDYHERTKEQARRDKVRDRAFLADGLTVMRFTGSEIWNAGQRCAAECVAYLFEGDE